MTPETSMSSAVNVLICACYPQALEKVPRVDNVGSLEPIPMIQQPFNSSCVALQYEPGTKFFYSAVPELHAVQVTRAKTYKLKIIFNA